MKSYEILVRSKGVMVKVDLICRNCNGIVGEWTGMVGTVHLDMDDVNGDIEKHVCEQG